MDADKLLAEASALDDAYAQAYKAEGYDRDLLALVEAARAVINTFKLDFECVSNLAVALEQFEPWLEQDEDPRSMGWVDDRGRP